MTTAVKTALCCAVRTALSDTRGVFICASGVEDRYVEGREWLYDVACLKYADGDFSWPLNRVYMVAECEWGRRQSVCEDFEKLLVARADVRVMVYNGARFEDHDELQNLIQQSRLTQDGDTFLLAAWLDDGFEYRCIRA